MHRTHGSFLTRPMFEQTIKEFEQEEAIWQKLHVGQILFMEHANSWDVDYFEHEIVEIDIHNRLITYKDNSQCGKIVKLGRLQTISQLANRSYLPVRFANTYTEHQIGIV